MDLRARTSGGSAGKGILEKLQLEQIAPGARVEVRDAEWRVRRVERTSNGKLAISCVGLSEPVQEKDAIFISDLDNIRVLAPEETALVADPSPAYRDGILHLESLLRQSPPTDARIYVGHRAAMDLVPFQLDPAIQALREPRRRILIADAVGLGKTIECGILLSELIRRGQGQRILVLAVKSMLSQFQKELWARFTIPLVRLDSTGIRRIRREIPTNQNPFHYYDKAIISIDTLKQESEYRTYVENARWDIIVIDEAHNVAERGAPSMRAKLARLLSDRSDTLIMLSATPHDGRRRSFASIMNMLNPTAIADPDHYGPEDIRGLFIRRFKKDIRAQVTSAFPERVIERRYCPATPAEEALHRRFAALRFNSIDQRRTGAMLFRTTLEKALFSSPAACLETVGNRIHRLQKQDDPAFAADLATLADLQNDLQSLSTADTAKYRELVSLLRDWDHRPPENRLVLFTERIETLRFLAKNLPGDLKLKENAVATLIGSDPDVDQQSIVERFGRDNDPIRLLIATDVASEGINLHYLCNRLVHYDIPWSLLTFQQRNGRIDRYGQTRQPHITYLVTRSEVDGIRGDLRILELLTEKDEQVTRNIGDPSEFTGIYDSEEEILHTARAIEEGLQDIPYKEENTPDDNVDALAILLGEIEQPTGAESLHQTATLPSLFESDFAYAARAIDLLRREENLRAEIRQDEQSITLTVPPDLDFRLAYLPPEIEFDHGQLHLTANRNKIQAEIARCRKEEREWPRLHLLWDQHPVLEWLTDKMTTRFRRHEAPVLTLAEALKPQEQIYIVSGVIPNYKGQPLIHQWLGLRFQRGQWQETLDFDEIIRITELGARAHPNPGGDLDTSALRDHLPTVCNFARRALSKARAEHDQRVRPQLDAQLARLRDLRGKQLEQLEFTFADKPHRRDQERRRVETLFNDYQTWIRETLTTEDKPYIRIAAVLRGGGEG